MVLTIDESIDLELGLDADISAQLDTGQQPEITADISDDALVDMDVTDGEVLELLVSEQIGGSSDTPAYTGSYTFTPSQSTQTVLISGKRATQNITINPIPSNYGLITWNGSTLTVS